VLIEPEVSEITIVLVGNLNPKIFNPDWFARHNLIAAADAEAASVQIIHNQIAAFQAGWLRVQVETERYLAGTTKGPSTQLLDLVLRTFRELLPHTPLRQLGINRNVHFSVGSREVRDNIGFRLAPPDAWGDWAAKIKAGDDQKRGGMISLVMQQSNVEERGQGSRGFIRTTLQPSTQVKANAGIYIEVNDHYEVADPANVQGCEEIVGILEKNYDSSLKRAEHIIDQVMRLRDG